MPQQTSVDVCDLNGRILYSVPGTLLLKLKFPSGNKVVCDNCPVGQFTFTGNAIVFSTLTPGIKRPFDPAFVQFCTPATGGLVIVPENVVAPKVKFTGVVFVNGIGTKTPDAFLNVPVAETEQVVPGSQLNLTTIRELYGEGVGRLNVVDEFLDNTTLLQLTVTLEGLAKPAGEILVSGCGRTLRVVALLNCKLILYPLAVVGSVLLGMLVHLKVHVATLVVLFTPPDTSVNPPVCPET